MNHPPVHDAFNGKVPAIVQAKASTGIRVTASADGLVPATTTLYASEQQGSALVADLAATVTAVHADDSPEALPVTWGSLPDLARTGVYTVNGVVQGTQAPAVATITVQRTGSYSKSLTFTLSTARP